MIEDEDKMYKIYEFLNSDSFFRPGTDINETPEKGIKLQDKNGNEKIFSKSYYAILDNGDIILIRISNHTTILDYWIQSGSSPEKSLQNVCILITDEIFHFSNKIEKTDIFDENGDIRKGYLFFVVEQYRYNANKISFSDFKKIIKKLKNSHNTQYGVFTDPLKRDPSKRAAIDILVPRDENGHKIPIPNKHSNLVNPRQIIVAEHENDNLEIDKNGNIINETEAIDMNSIDDYDFLVHLNDAYNGNTETFYTMQDFLNVYFSFKKGKVLSDIDLNI